MVLMQVLAAGALRPKEAIEYIGKFPKIESVCLEPPQNLIFRKQKN